jgi:hypothetical protein
MLAVAPKGTAGVDEFLRNARITGISCSDDRQLLAAPILIDNLRNLAVRR